MIKLKENITERAVSDIKNCENNFFESITCDTFNRLSSRKPSIKKEVKRMQLFISKTFQKSLFNAMQYNPLASLMSVNSFQSLQYKVQVNSNKKDSNGKSSHKSEPASDKLWSTLHSK